MSEVGNEVEARPAVADRVMAQQEEGLVGAVREFLPSFPAITTVEAALGGIAMTVGVGIEAFLATHLPPQIIDAFGQIGVQALSKLNLIQYGALVAGIVTLGLGGAMIIQAGYENDRYVRELQTGLKDTQSALANERTAAGVIDREQH